MTARALSTEQRLARDWAWMREIERDGVQAISALDGLMRAYDGRFLRYLNVCGVPEQDAEGLLGDLWVELATAPLRCRQDAEPSSWLLGVLANRIKRYFGKLERDRNTREQLNLTAARATPSPEALAQVVEFLDAVEGLPENERERFELVRSFYGQEMEIEEVATLRFEQCLVRHCICVTRTRADCKRATHGATRRELARARIAVRSFFRKYF